MPSTPPVRTTTPPFETSRTTRRGVLTALGAAASVATAGCLGGDRDYDDAAGVASRTADWPTLGHGYSHTSYAPEEAGPNAKPSVAWSHEVFPTGQPVIVDDRVLVPDGESLRCFALEGGTEQWTYAADESAWTTPTVVGDRVYLAAGHDGIHAVSLSDGRRVDRWPLEGFVSAPPTPDRDGERLYVGTKRGRIHAIPLVGATTGGTSTDGSTSTDDAASSGKSTATGESTSTDGSTPTGEAFGSPADGWIAELYGAFDAPVTPTRYGLFAATTGGEVYGLDTRDGRGRWRTKLPGIVTAAPAATKGDVYVACLEAGLYRLRGERAGQIAWHHDGGGFVTGALTVAHGSVIGARANSVVAVDADTGTEEWSADVGGSPQRAAAVAGDTLYVGAFGAGVRAFRLSGGGLAGLVGAPRRWGLSLPGSAGEGVAVANGTVVAVGEGGEDYPSRVSALR